MNEYMVLALEEARLAAREGEIPVGAVLVQNDQVLARAHNRREALCDPTAHAEMLCLREAAQKLGTWRMRDCTLYVTLEPCPMCAGAMVMSQLSHCVYGAYEPRQGCCGSVYDLPADPALHGQTHWQCGEGAQEAAALLQTFFAARRPSNAILPEKEQKNNEPSKPSENIHEGGAAHDAQ